MIPRPYQQPHPKAFQPFSVSESTIRHTAKVGVMPMILVSNPPDFRRLCADLPGGRRRRTGAHSSSARTSARSAPSRSATPREQAWRLLERTNYFGFNAYFAGFGFWEAFRFAEDAEKYPLDPYTPLPPSEWTLERFANVKYGLAGTVDDIKREIEALATIHGGDGELEWFSLVLRPGPDAARRGPAPDRAVRRAHHPRRSAEAHPSSA